MDDQDAKSPSEQPGDIAGVHGIPDGMPPSASDMLEEPVHVRTTPDEFEDQVRVDMRHRGRDHTHVDLTQEEYTPQEVARLIGTSLDVVMHAIWQGDLKATRQGKDVVCIDHSEVTDWLRRRGGV